MQMGKIGRASAVLAISLLAFLGMGLGGLSPTAPAADRPVQAANGMVVSVSPPASDVGLEVLRQGGSAVDAAVATAFAMAVTWPSAGNIGGGGFMMVCPGPGHRPVCVEYRETAPARATVDMLAHDSSMVGHKVSGTPGTVAGMALAHKQYGKLPWRDLVMPAVRLARNGFPVDRALASSLNGVLRTSQKFAEFQRVFAPPAGKAQWQAGDRLVQPDLARTLERIATDGPDAFYRGPIADQLVAEMEAGGGLISKQDLASYKANLREPIHGTYRGYDVYGAPPPSSGGICLVMMLNILENFQLNEQPATSSAANPHTWTPRNMHLVVESMRRAYCDRARHLGDPAFTKIPGHLTSKAYAKQLAAGIDLARAGRSEALAPEIHLAPESEETTHFSVIDKTGMAVSNTYTLENSYGSRVVVRGAGFLLNNEMTDFNRVPGRTDRKGSIGTPANLIAPGKRMLSSQTPTLVCRDGRVVLVTGSPGGRTIINTVLCMVIHTLDFGLDLQQAVNAPRLHHAWFPDRISFEGLMRPEYADCVEQLRRMGHQFDAKAGKQGDAHSIWVDRRTGHYVGAADPRIDGKVSAY